MRQGPHHVAQRSTRTGSRACSATSAKSSSPASAIHGSDRWQLPHLGTPSATAGTRLRVPQCGQVITVERVMGVVLPDGVIPAPRPAPPAWGTSCVTTRRPSRTSTVTREPSTTSPATRARAIRAWVPETLRNLCDLLILVDRPPRRSCRWICRLGCCAPGERSWGSGLSEGAVRPVIVVVAFELVQHGSGVSFIDDQDSVEEFAADGADEALGDRVRPRCPHRRLDDAGVEGGEDGVEGGGELGVAVADEEPEARPASSRSMSRLRACWVSQAAVGWAVTPRMCTRRVACSMTKNTYSRCRVMVSRWNRSQARIACACARRNSLHDGPARRGEGSMPAACRIGPDGGGADLVAEAGELAVDPSVSPGGILGGQPHDQGAQAGGDGWSTGSDGLRGPAAGEQLAVPAQDRGRGDEQPEAAAGGE